MHNYIKPAITSYRCRSASGMIKHFPDSPFSPLSGDQRSNYNSMLTYYGDGGYPSPAVKEHAFPFQEPLFHCDASS